MSDAIKTFLPPPGYIVVKPPPSNRSMMWSHGAVIEHESEFVKQKPGDAGRKVPVTKWVCLAGKKCRSAMTMISCAKKGSSYISSEVTQHLKSKHDLK